MSRTLLLTMVSPLSRPYSPRRRRVPGLLALLSLLSLPMAAAAQSYCASDGQPAPTA
ncbi:MAG: hypothetical protein JWP29_4102, partial [Rhodoferax sp.]|nr:hypothetical protein [Rhodoferax sp.]